MRAGPLSNHGIIELLNAHFAPVYVSNEDYTEDGPAPAEERAERNRIWREANEAGLSSGTVHAYVLSPDGTVSDSLHVARAARVEETRTMLERAIEKYRPAAGAPLVKPAAQSRPPAVEPGGLVLHLTARYLEAKDDQLVPLTDVGLGETRNASWSAYAAENWTVYSPGEAPRLLPAGDLAPGTTWDVDDELAARLLVVCYPSTECNDASRNRILSQELRGEIVSLDEGRVRARLTGRLTMKHNFYPGREDENVVEATFVGYLDFDPVARRIEKLRLTTTEGRYAGQRFGVAVELLTPAVGKTPSSAP